MVIRGVLFNARRSGGTNAVLAKRPPPLFCKPRSLCGYGDDDGGTSAKGKRRTLFIAVRNLTAAATYVQEEPELTHWAGIHSGCPFVLSSFLTQRDEDGPGHRKRKEPIRGGLRLNP